MSLYPLAVTQSTKMLGNVEKWLDKAVAFAEAKKFDPNTLLDARLAPDMFPLVRQIQSICDGAKLTAARLTNKEVPKHPDNEKTIDELRARIASVKEILATFKEEDFAGAEDRVVPLAFMPGKGLRGRDYYFEMQTPNFYFHLTAAYAILRHNGVELGKFDFIGSVPFIDV
jgi:hypothetical protein